MDKKKFNNSTLAIELGYSSASSVQKWVKGRGMPELKRIPQIAKTLDVSESYLLHGVQDQKDYDTESEVSKVEEPMATYGISKDELIEFYQWKANKSKLEAETAIKQVEKLKSDKVDAI